MRGTKPHLVVDNDAIKSNRSAPAWMAAEAKAEWRRVFPVLRQRKILTVTDLGALENYCVSMGTVRQMEKTLQTEGRVVTTEKGLKRHPATAIQAEAMTSARRAAAELGLTPVSRSRPAVRGDNESDDGDDW
jgi:P27 family predicted phage terminase small subunit